MKTVSALITFLITLLAISLSAQTLVPKKCYLHLTGKIGKEFNVEMNLVKINDTLWGDYFFLRQGKFPEGKAYQDGSMIPLYGKVSADGSFVIHENPWARGGKFTGRFTGATGLSGTWESIDGTNRTSFSLTENYPGGSVPMNVHTMKGSVPLVKKAGSPRATFEYAMLLPAESANPIFSDSLNRLVLEKFANRPVQADRDPDQLLLGMKQVYFDNYIASNEAIYNQIKGMSYEWISTKTMNILLNGSGFLSFFIESYAFTGGAHGISSRDCFIISLQTGKQFELVDLFRDGYENALTQLITKKVRQIYSVPENQPLKDAGFFVDSVKPASNFYLTRNGIGFYYNYYEIAPHSNGPTDLFIPFPELASLLKPETPVRKLIAP